MAVGTGETTLDFLTGKDLVTVTVARATVTASTQVESYLYPKATANKTVDEHLVDPPVVVAHSVVAGVGFSITARSPGKTWLFGIYNVRWVASE